MSNTSPRPTRVEFHPFGWIVDFVDCPKVVGALDRMLAGWELRRRDPSGADGAAPVAEITRVRDKHFWKELGRNKPRYWSEDGDNSTWDAVCDTIDVMIDWFLDDFPDYLCLHGAAARIGDQLVCFPSIGKAGKSTLCIELTARGQQLFCDDVLPLEHTPAGARTVGLGLGLPPRVRLPVPATSSGPFRKLMRTHGALESTKWRYFALDPDQLARYGERRPIQAFVLLERGDGFETALEPISQKDMLIEVVKQNFAETRPGIEILDRLIAATGAADTFRLRYDRAEQGARALIDRFDDVEAAGRDPANGASARPDRDG